jgi:hypothetical protein
MELDRLNPELVARLLGFEENAAHLSVLADVAAAYAHVAREKADAAQAGLSAIKVWLALLPDDVGLELRAPKPASASPPERLGVRPRSVPRSDREESSPCLDRTTLAPRSSATAMGMSTSTAPAAGAARS